MCWGGGLGWWGGWGGGKRIITSWPSKIKRVRSFSDLLLFQKLYLPLVDAKDLLDKTALLHLLADINITYHVILFVSIL